MPKQIWITNLRVFATLSVILLHAAANGADKFGKIPLQNWWVCNIINTFGRFAVPVFIMLSGYLLLGRYKDLSSFLTKRLSRVFIPFVVWILLYIVWANIYGIRTEKISWDVDIILHKLLIGGGGGSFHLWFVYMLIGLYAITPIISRWITQAPETEVRYFLLLWLVSSVGYTWAEHWWGVSISYDLRYFSGYVGYFVLGYWLGNKKWRVSPVASGICFLLMWALTAYLVYWVFTADKQYDRVYTSYLTPVVIAMSVSIFLFFREACNIEFLPTVVNQLDACSYGIYLAHILILRVLSRFYYINYTWHSPIVGIFTHFILCSIICFAIIYLLSKIPKSQWITG